MTPPGDKPLAGKRIVVACSAGKSDTLLRGLQSAGAEVLPLETIRLVEVSDKSPLKAAIANLKTYHWIVFTSAYGVVFFSRCLDESETDNRRHMPPVCAVGPATAEAARQCGFAVSLLPGEYVADSILQALADRHGGVAALAGLRLLLPRAREGREILPRQLAAAGAIVDVVACYENNPGEIDTQTRDRLRQWNPHVVVFTSSSTVNRFFQLLGQDLTSPLLQQAAVAAIGPVTAATVQSYGRRCDIVPPQNTIPSLVQSIVDSVGSG
jgi:uroporphyrinogen III methyltransferase / synthase